MGSVHRALHAQHGSRLNQAEIEISLFSRQCLGSDESLRRATCDANTGTGTGA